MAVVAAQLVLIATLTASTAGVSPPNITIDWSASTTGCETDPNATAQVAYEIHYDNFAGPSGYAIMALGYGGHMRRYWAAFVPAGSFQLTENGTVLFPCSAAWTFRIALLSTLAS